MNVDELMPKVSLEQAAAYYGVPLPELHRAGAGGCVREPMHPTRVAQQLQPVLQAPFTGERPVERLAKLEELPNGERAMGQCPEDLSVARCDQPGGCCHGLVSSVACAPYFSPPHHAAS